MKPRFLTSLASLATLWCLCATATHAADAPAAAPVSCDTLRAQIEAKVGAAGVSQFAVTVVDAQAVAQGQVVGSCERGTKKVMYQRLDASGAPAAPARAGAAPMLTECKDGSSSVGGDCRK